MKKEAYNKNITGKNPFLANSPQEGSFNHTMVVKNNNKKNITYLWQPHNHRLYFDFNKSNFNPIKPSYHTLKKYESMVGIFNTAYTYTPLNHNSEHKYENFMGCQIRVKKNQVEVINKWHNKQWRKLTAENLNQINEMIDKEMETLTEQSIEALKSFIDLHKGKSRFEILKLKCEQGIHGDEYLDKIPRELIIHDTYFKKEYAKKVEMFKVAEVKNYISTRCIENIAPEIAGEINNIHNTIQEDLTPSLKQLNESVQLEIYNKKLHLSVLHDIKNTQKSNLELNKAMKNTLEAISNNLPKKTSINQTNKGFTDKEMGIIRNIKFDINGSII